ncbi:MAG: 4Fe-4S binding protein [Deltaproteobacteria bacterium]|nr:4Fe-4S binding protein [Deltaproteobacteria bacterium]
MCHWCNQHGDRDHKWYERVENYLFNKVFPTPEDQERVKQEMVKTFADTEWRYSDAEFIRNHDFLQARASKGFSSQIVIKEEMLRILKIAEEATKREDSIMVAGHCPCRLVYEGTRDYVCIGFGMPVTMSMEIGYGRLPGEGLTEYGGAEWKNLRKELRKGAKVPLKLEEAEELIDEWEKRGLWHIVMSRGRLPLIEAICNCERRYCTYWMNRFRSGVKEYVLKGHYIARVNPLKCTSCGHCFDRCQFGALHYSKTSDNVDIDMYMCFGCGLCYSACPNEAIELISRAKIPAIKNLW